MVKTSNLTKSLYHSLDNFSKIMSHLFINVSATPVIPADVSSAARNLLHLDSVNSQDGCLVELRRMRRSSDF